MQSYTFLRIVIDCPLTKIVTWVHDTEIHNEKSISKNGLPNVNFSIMHPCNDFGLWTVNKKLDEYVTLHSNF